MTINKLNGTECGTEIAKKINEIIDSVGSGGRNVGEIITSSLPLTDAGLHLLDGTKLSGDGIYKEFVEYIADLYGDGTNIPSYFCTEAQWQASVTQYDVCAKFVYDSTLNTVRLPKITGIIEGTTDLAALGDLIEAGLPNITGTSQEMIFRNGNYNSRSGCLNYQRIGAFWDSNSGSSYQGDRFQLNIDASRSSSIYGNATTVQPQTIKVLYYICIATSAKTDIEVDIDDIATDLNGKADVDLTNVNNSGTSRGAGWAMPSSTYDDLTLGASGTSYTAPANGWVFLSKTATDPGQYVEIANMTGGSISQVARSVYNTQGIATYTPVSKGDIFSVGYTAGGNTRFFRFIYAKGSESEES